MSLHFEIDRSFVLSRRTPIEMLHSLVSQYPSCQRIKISLQQEKPVKDLKEIFEAECTNPSIPASGEWDTLDGEVIRKENITSRAALKRILRMNHDRGFVAVLLTRMAAFQMRTAVYPVSRITALTSLELEGMLICERDMYRTSQLFQVLSLDGFSDWIAPADYANYNFCRSEMQLFFPAQAQLNVHAPAESAVEAAPVAKENLSGISLKLEECRLRKDEAMKHIQHTFSKLTCREDAALQDFAFTRMRTHMHTRAKEIENLEILFKAARDGEERAFQKSCELITGYEQGCTKLLTRSEQSVWKECKRECENAVKLLLDTAEVMLLRVVLMMHAEVSQCQEVLDFDAAVYFLVDALIRCLSHGLYCYFDAERGVKTRCQPISRSIIYYEIKDCCQICRYEYEQYAKVNVAKDKAMAAIQKLGYTLREQSSNTAALCDVRSKPNTARDSLKDEAIPPKLVAVNTVRTVQQAQDSKDVEISKTFAVLAMANGDILLAQRFAAVSALFDDALHHEGQSCALVGRKGLKDKMIKFQKAAKAARVKAQVEFELLRAELQA